MKHHNTSAWATKVAQQREAARTRDEEREGFESGNVTEQPKTFNSFGGFARRTRDDESDGDGARTTSKKGRAGKGSKGGGAKGAGGRGTSPGAGTSIGKGSSAREKVQRRQSTPTPRQPTSKKVSRKSAAAEDLENDNGEFTLDAGAERASSKDKSKDGGRQVGRGYQPKEIDVQAALWDYASGNFGRSLEPAGTSVVITTCCMQHLAQPFAFCAHTELHISKHV